MLIFYKVNVNVVQALFLWPVAIIITLLGTVGPSCWLAALNVKYRDFRYLIPFLVQALLFLTPVIYPVTGTNYPWLKFILAANPLYGAIMIFKLPFLSAPPDWQLIQLSLFSCVIFVIIGIYYFRKTEAYFADLA
jgi:lipopolysaccharide transport system permease protein